MFLPALCVDPLNPAGRPTPANLVTYGFRAIRSVFRPDPQWYSYHQAASRVGLASIVTLARESFALSLPDTIASLPTDADWVVVGNEPDGEGISSWRQSPAEFLALIAECAPLIRQRCPQAQIVAGGLVSGQPGWLVRVVVELAGLVDAFDVHPYAKDTNQAAALLREYEALVGGVPLVVLEWNRQASQIPAFTTMLEQMTQAAAWFCWSDGMVDGFGLIDRQGNPQASLSAIMTALKPAAPAPPPISPPENRPNYVLGFAEFAGAHPELVGDPLEDERGGVPGFSQQLTSRGILTAANLADRGWTLLFWERESGTRYLFESGVLEAIA